jgi:hypothetical protein
MSDILSLEFSEYFPNVLVEIITDFARCKVCDEVQKKFNSLKKPFIIRSKTAARKLYFTVDDQYVYLSYTYDILYGDRNVDFKTTVKYLAMMLAHNLDINHLQANMIKYDCEDMAQHVTLPRKPLISQKTLAALMNYLKDIVS